MEYELTLLGHPDQWSHRVWSTIRELQGTLGPCPQLGAPLPSKNISIPIGEFHLHTQRELDSISSVVWVELRKFTREHSLVRGLLASYAPIPVSGDKKRVEMRVGKREVEALKTRLADLTLPQMVPIDLTDHLVIPPEWPHSHSGEGRVQGTKGPFPDLPQMLALCIDRAVIRRKGSTEVDGGSVLSRWGQKIKKFEFELACKLPPFYMLS